MTPSVSIPDFQLTFRCLLAVSPSLYVLVLLLHRCKTMDPLLPYTPLAPRSAAGPWCSLLLLLLTLTPTPALLLVQLF